jgi:hypothetical protein
MVGGALPNHFEAHLNFRDGAESLVVSQSSRKTRAHELQTRNRCVPVFLWKKAKAMVRARYVLPGGTPLG